VLELSSVPVEECDAVSQNPPERKRQSDKKIKFFYRQTEENGMKTIRKSLCIQELRLFSEK
jgi:hypothetical protein